MEYRKSCLIRYQGCLKNEIIELDKRLEESEEEAVGAAKQRTELLEQKNEIEETTRSLLDGVDAFKFRLRKHLNSFRLHLQNACNHFVKSSRVQLAAIIFL